jgi:uncharacterized tellurite resistance protein B-like protein
MRSYAKNSPQAAARIVALLALADGSLSKIEVNQLDKIEAHVQLGMPRAELHSVLQTLCEDLQPSAHQSWADSSRVDANTLKQLMAEVTDQKLRATVMELCVAVVIADGHVAERESKVLAAALEHWQVTREPQAS